MRDPNAFFENVLGVKGVPDHEVGGPVREDPPKMDDGFLTELYYELSGTMPNLGDCVFINDKYYFFLVGGWINF